MANMAPRRWTQSPKLVMEAHPVVVWANATKLLEQDRI